MIGAWRSRLSTPAALVVGFTVLMSCVHLLWLHHFRHAAPLDIDEAGYLSLALDDLHGWQDAGLGGLHGAVMAQSYGPLVPLAATPLLGLFGERPWIGISVQLLFLVILAVATFSLGAALRGGAAGFVAVVTTLLAPSVLDFTRSFHFVLASTAFLCLATCGLARSGRWQRTDWAVLAGLATGLMLLSRTYTVGFLPGLGVASLILITATEGPRARAWGNALLAGVTALAVAGWWWIPNRRAIFEYLSGYGYGSQARLYAEGGVVSRSNLRFWTARLSELVSEGVYLAAAAVLVVALIAYTFARIRRRAQPGGSRRLGAAVAALATPAGVAATVVAISYFVLTSTANKGLGFTAPLVPLVVCLGVSCAWTLRPLPRLVLTSSLVVAVALVALGKTTRSGALASVRCARLPVLGCATITDGRWIAGRFPAYGEADRAGTLRPWSGIGREAALRIQTHRNIPGAPVVVFFASRDPLFNTNTVALAWRQLFRRPLPVGQLRPEDGGDTETNYLAKLALPEFGQPNFLFTADSGRFEFEPPVTQPRAERAARCLGFVLVDEFALPDGRMGRLYERETPLPAPTDRGELSALATRCGLEQTR